MTIKKSFLVIVVLLTTKSVSAQQNVWDIPATELMISHNKQNFSDHQTIRNNQIVSEGTVKSWKNSTNNFKTLSDFIDKRLTSAFIIVADAVTLYNIYDQLSEMMDYEAKALDIAYRHPWAISILSSQEGKIIKSGSQLFNYISLIAISYGDISKMKASARKVIFHEISLQISVLKAQCYSLYNLMKRLDLASEVGKTKPGTFINKDAQIVKDILKNLK